VASLLPALLFGVAFGNIFRGLPMDAAGYHGSLLSLLNPYGLLTGALFVLLFLVHGALYASVKTAGGLAVLAGRTAVRLWPVLLVVAVLFLGATPFATHLDDNYRAAPVLLVIPAIAVAALLAMRFFLARGAGLLAFAASCVTILFVVFTGVAGLFPCLIPSRLDAAHHLTIYNSSSSLLTLTIMTVVALVFIPVVIAYKIWVYRIFRAPVTVAAVRNNPDAY
jgi:cytochrome d ubiquinol oxidase subunit II